MVTLPFKGHSLMVGDRTVEGARQILIGEHRFQRAGQTWNRIEEQDWMTNVPSIELSATSVLGMDDELFEDGVAYGAELDDIIGVQVTELTEEQRELIALSDILNKVPPRKTEGMSAEELVEVANQGREEFEEANGMVRYEDGEPAEDENDE